MPVTVVCTDCRKSYAVPEATVGRRVKCKQCGNAFVAAIARVKTPLKTSPQGVSRTAVKSSSVAGSSNSSKPRVAVKSPAAHRPVVPEPEEYRFKDEEDNWSHIEAAVNGPAEPEYQSPGRTVNSSMTASLQYAGAGWDFTRRILGRFSFHTNALLGSMGLCLLLAVVALVIPDAAVFAIFAFPVIALAYLLIGLVIVAAPVLRQPGQLKLPVGDILFVCVQLLIGLVIPLPVVVYRRQAIGRGMGTFYKSAFGVFFRAGVIFAMALASPLLAHSMGVNIPSIPELSGKPTQHAGPADHHHNYEPDPRTTIILMDDPKPSNPSPDQPAAPQSVAPPQAVAPVMPARMPPPNTQIQMAQTQNNLINLASRIGRYRRSNENQVPRTLDDLTSPELINHLRVSPFDDSKGTNGYVYLPDNLQAGHGRVFIYDAAELAKTGSTHAMRVEASPPVIVMTRAELAAQPGVTLGG